MTLARKIQVGLVVVAVVVAAVPIGFLASRLHFGDAIVPAAADYGIEGRAACELGSRPGGSDGSDLERTGGGARFSVRVPTNYRETHAHPLIVVYAPRGTNRFLLERFTGLTRGATTAGFVIAFADARRLSLETIADLATIPEGVASRWCIDRDRVSLTGHSDGGTTAAAIAFGEKTRGIAAAIAPSAAGIRGSDLLAETCPAPLSVLVLHGREDSLFPGWGAEAARWWATCNGCDEQVVVRHLDGCLVYPGCDRGVETIYCEGRAGHLDWPEREEAMLRSFARARRASGSSRDGRVGPFQGLLRNASRAPRWSFDTPSIGGLLAQRKPSRLRRPEAHERNGYPIERGGGTPHGSRRSRKSCRHPHEHQVRERRER